MPRLTDRFVVLSSFVNSREHERLHMLGFLCQTEQPCVTMFIVRVKHLTACPFFIMVVMGLSASW
jgi:hypothetical protein